MKEAIARPEISKFVDARTFLGAFIEWKQANEKHFSFRKLSFLADLGSPSYVQTYLSGKRNLKNNTARKIAEAVGLNGHFVAV